MEVANPPLLPVALLPVPTLLGVLTAKVQVLEDEVQVQCTMNP